MMPPDNDLQLYLNPVSVIESLESIMYLNSKFIIYGDYNMSSLTWVGGKTGFKIFNFISFSVGQSLI
jgi:hypothetical protein